MGNATRVSGEHRAPRPGGDPVIDTTNASRARSGSPRNRQAHFAYLEMLSRRMVMVVLVTAAVFSALFTIFGPIGTYVTFTPLQRIAYVVVLGALGLPIYFCFMVVTLYYSRRRSPWACTLAVVPAIAVGAVAVTATAYVLHVVVYPESVMPELGALYLSSFAGAITAAMLFCYMIFQRVSVVRDVRDSVTAGDQTTASGSLPMATYESIAPVPMPITTGERNVAESDMRRGSFQRRLPDGVRGRIIFLKTESHYVRVHTTAGTCRLLLRFADAVDELAGLGMQVHRSYWVAHDQVLEVVKRNNRVTLRLTGDHEVPVSRTYTTSVCAMHLK
jgi:hypothetical protein